MTYLLLAIAAAMLLSAAGVVAYLERRRGVRRHLRRRIVVHRSDGSSIKGILIAEFADCLELAHAEYPTAEGDALLAGTVLIPRGKIAFVQTLPTAEASGE